MLGHAMLANTLQGGPNPGEIDLCEAIGRLEVAAINSGCGEEVGEARLDLSAGEAQSAEQLTRKYFGMSAVLRTISAARP